MLAANGHDVTVDLEVRFAPEGVALGVLVPAQGHEVLLRVGRRGFGHRVAKSGESHLWWWEERPSEADTEKTSGA